MVQLPLLAGVAHTIAPLDQVGTWPSLHPSCPIAEVEEL
jgi:hypothetical protein